MFKPKQCCEACVFGRCQHASWCHLTNVYWISQRKQFETESEWGKRCGVILNVLKESLDGLPLY